MRLGAFSVPAASSADARNSIADLVCGPRRHVTITATRLVSGGLPGRVRAPAGRLCGRCARRNPCRVRALRARLHGVRSLHRNRRRDALALLGRLVCLSAGRIAGRSDFWWFDPHGDRPQPPSSLLSAIPSPLRISVTRVTRTRVSACGKLPASCGNDAPARLTRFVYQGDTISAAVEADTNLVRKSFVCRRRPPLTHETP
jgi:hypothetical protein